MTCKEELLVSAAEDAPCGQYEAGVKPEEPS